MLQRRTFKFPANWVRRGAREHGVVVGEAKAREVSARTAHRERRPGIVHTDGALQHNNFTHIELVHGEGGSSSKRCLRGASQRRVAEAPSAAARVVRKPLKVCNALRASLSVGTGEHEEGRA